MAGNPRSRPGNEGPRPPPPPCREEPGTIVKQLKTTHWRLMVTLAALLNTRLTSLRDSFLSNTLGLFRLEALRDAEEEPGGPQL